MRYVDAAYVDIVYVVHEALITLIQTWRGVATLDVVTRLSHFLTIPLQLVISFTYESLISSWSIRIQAERKGE